MIIKKHYTVKVTGAWQSYVFSQGFEIDSANSTDIGELVSIVGNLSNFENINSAVTYACQKLVYDEISTMVDSDADFKVVWYTRNQELRNKEQQLNIEVG